MCTVYATFVYKYVSILQYFSVLSFLLHMIILCLSSFSKKLSSFFLESRVMLCMYTLYFKRCTLYKFIEINSVLFCSVKLNDYKGNTFNLTDNIAERVRQPLTVSPISTCYNLGLVHYAKFRNLNRRTFS